MERVDDAPGQVRLAPTVWIAHDDLRWSQSRSSGPGGQNVNKTESKAELRLPPQGLIGMDHHALGRLRSQPGLRLDAEGLLLIVCDETRSLRRNRELALDRLRACVLQALVRPRVRRPTRPSRASKMRRLEAKVHNAKRKDQRRVSDE